MEEIQFERARQDVDEVIGIIPGWIVRWGISIALLCLLSLLFISSYISYPDSLPGTIELEALEQPYRFDWNESETGTYQIKVKENQNVETGDTLITFTDLNKSSSGFKVSPVEGRILVTDAYKNNLHMRTIWVVRKISKYQAIFKLTSNASGQIKIGQRVLINLAEFPESEFGYVEGLVTKRIPVKVDGQYIVYVSLANGLRTSTNQNLPDQPNFSGTAEILLDSRSVLHRVLGALLVLNK